MAPASMRGSLRPSQSAPHSYVFLALSLMVVVLAFNYWSSSSKNRELLEQLSNFQHKHKVCFEEVQAQRKTSKNVEDNLEKSNRELSELIIQINKLKMSEKGYIEQIESYGRNISLVKRNYEDLINRTYRACEQQVEESRSRAEASCSKEKDDLVKNQERAKEQQEQQLQLQQQKEQLLQETVQQQKEELRKLQAEQKQQQQQSNQYGEGQLKGQGSQKQKQQNKGRDWSQKQGEGQQYIGSKMQEEGKQSESWSQKQGQEKDSERPKQGEGQLSKRWSQKQGEGQQKDGQSQNQGEDQQKDSLSQNEGEDQQMNGQTQNQGDGQKSDSLSQNQGEGQQKDGPSENQEGQQKDILSQRKAEGQQKDGVSEKQGEGQQKDSWSKKEIEGQPVQKEASSAEKSNLEQDEEERTKQTREKKELEDQNSAHTIDVPAQDDSPEEKKNTAMAHPTDTGGTLSKSLVSSELQQPKDANFRRATTTWVQQLPEAKDPNLLKFGTDHAPGLRPAHWVDGARRPDELQQKMQQGSTGIQSAGAFAGKRENEETMQVNKTGSVEGQRGISTNVEDANKQQEKMIGKPGQRQVAGSPGQLGGITNLKDKNLENIEMDMEGGKETAEDIQALGYPSDGVGQDDSQDVAQEES